MVIERHDVYINNATREYVAILRREGHALHQLPDGWVQYNGTSEHLLGLGYKYIRNYHSRGFLYRPQWYYPGIYWNCLRKGWLLGIVIAAIRFGIVGNLWSDIGAPVVFVVALAVSSLAVAAAAVIVPWLRIRLGYMAAVLAGIAMIDIIAGLLAYTISGL